jgi:hydroxymethylpyrimidine/phosphomethylpyrimidine kinase
MTSEPKSYHRVLTVATSDSGGGAGVQADLKTISALGCYGVSAFAALTAQNTQEVRAIHEVPPQFLAAQIDTVIEDIGVNAVKIGMLFNAGLIHTMADRIEAHQLQKVILDPVMVSQSGYQLIEDDAVKVLQQVLFPLCELITPNIPEAEKLLGNSIQTEDDIEQAACDLLQMGPRAVLLKGGHLQKKSQSADCLAIALPDGKGVDIHWYRSERIETDNTHGTGCTLSSAIASERAKGKSLPKAIEEAKRYITKAIGAGSEYQLGEGSGPLHHFYQIWN